MQPKNNEYTKICNFIINHYYKLNNNYFSNIYDLKNHDLKIEMPYLFCKRKFKKICLSVKKFLNLLTEIVYLWALGS